MLTKRKKADANIQLTSNDLKSKTLIRESQEKHSVFFYENTKSPAKIFIVGQNQFPDLNRRIFFREQRLAGNRSPGNRASGSRG